MGFFRGGFGKRRLSQEFNVAPTQVTTNNRGNQEVRCLSALSRTAMDAVLLLPLGSHLDWVAWNSLDSVTNE